MRQDTIYTADRSFDSVDANDTPISFKKGEKIVATGFDTAYKEDGTDVTFAPHVARHPDWYFTRDDEFNPRKPQVTQNEYVLELARSMDGLDAGGLYEIASLEGFGPLNRPVPYSGFTRCLTDAVASGKVEMRKDGERVEGVGHNVKGATYHAATGPLKHNADGRFG